MRKHKLTSIIILLLAVTISFTFCTNKKNALSKIEIATGYCHGECPFTASIIDSALNYNFYGGKFASKQGYYKGKISKSLWDSINVCLNQIDYTNMPAKYLATVDGQTLEVFLYYNGVVKHINTQFDALPKNIAKAFYEIAMSYNKVKLVPETESIKFNTVVQNELPLPNPKFPPPNPKH